MLHVTIHTTDGEFDSEYPVRTSESTTYNVSLDYVTGTITGFDFTPTNMDCTIYIDDITFVAVDPEDDRFFLKQAQPTDGAANVERDADAVLYFSRNIDISQAAVTLNGEPVTALSIDETGKKLIIDLGEMESLKSYTLKVSGVKSVKGSVMEPYEVSFITKIYEKVLFSDDFSKGDLAKVWPDTLTGIISSEPGTYNSAPYSMKVSYPTQGYSKVELRSAMLDVGKVYRMSFYAMKPKGSTNTGIMVVNPDEGFYVKTFGTPQNTMQYYEIEFTARYNDSSKNTEGATIKPPFLRFTPTNDPNNVVYLDDIKLVELGENQRIENSDIDKKGHKNISVSEPIELEYAYKISSVKNVTLTTAQGKKLTGSNAAVQDTKVTITLDNNIKYNTYYTLTADAVDIYGRSFKIETYLITEEQVEYDSIEILKNGTALTSATAITAGDRLTVKISNLRNKSANDSITLRVIPSIYGAEGTLEEAGVTPISLNKGQTIPEKEIYITVPSGITAKRLSVCVWSEISDNLIKSEVSNCYNIN